MSLKTGNHTYLPIVEGESEVPCCLDKTLDEIEQKFRTVLGAVAGGILAVDEQQKVLFSNRRLQAQALVAAESLLPGHTAMMGAGEVRSWVKGADNFARRVEEIYGTLYDVSHDLFEHVDGRVFELDSIPLLADDNLVGRVWHFTDVTGTLASPGFGS